MHTQVLATMMLLYCNNHGGPYSVSVCFTLVHPSGTSNVVLVYKSDARVEHVPCVSAADEEI